MEKDELERAEEHVKVAGEIVMDTAKNMKGKCRETLEDAALSLERAEGDIEEVENTDSC
ncbi:MAG: hypothetical protein WC494_01355 [Candidatus Pacearchaeota archaeon]